MSHLFYRPIVEGEQRNRRREEFSGEAVRARDRFVVVARRQAGEHEPLFGQQRRLLASLPGAAAQVVRRTSHLYLRLSHSLHPAEQNLHRYEVINKHTCNVSERISVCVAAPTKFMIYSQRNLAVRLLPDSRECLEAVLPIHRLKLVKAIDFDPVHQNLYWVTIFFLFLFVPVF